jgi:hypothetical protein
MTSIDRYTFYSLTSFSDLFHQFHSQFPFLRSIRPLVTVTLRNYITSYQCITDDEKSANIGHFERYFTDLNDDITRIIAGSEKPTQFEGENSHPIDRYR